MTCTTPRLAVILVRYEIFDLLHFDILSYTQRLHDDYGTLRSYYGISVPPFGPGASLFFSMASVDPLHRNDTETQIEG